MNMNKVELDPEAVAVALQDFFGALGYDPGYPLCRLITECVAAQARNEGAELYLYRLEGQE